MCDDEINIEEIEKSLKGMKKETPGPDVLDKFGFGNKLKKLDKNILHKHFSSVKCNGFLTPYFRLKNSVKQGCPISALLYVLLAEQLSIAIKKNYEIRGVVIPNTNVEEKVFVHADDTTLTLVDKNSVSETFRVLELYEKASGAKLNKEKSEVLALGKGKICSNDLKIWKIKECDEVLQLLGIWVGKNKTLCENLNWESKVQSVTKILNFWKMRHLTLHGRVSVISALLMSKLWYTLMVVNIPEKYCILIKNNCLEFLWNNKPPLVAYDVIINKVIDGGLNFPDIMQKIHLLKQVYVKSKDIAYECKPGFLKESYIQEIVSEQFPEVSENKILHAVRNVLETLPDEYKVLVEANVHDCERQPCECKCDNCLNLLKDCTCMDQNIDGDKDKNDESEVVKDDDAESSENTNDDEQTELKKADDSHMNVKTIVAEVHVNSGGIQEDSRKRKLDRDEHIFDDGYDGDDINVIEQAQDKNKRADSDSDEEVKKKKNEECSPVDIVVTEECNVEMATEEHSIDRDDEYSTLDDDEEVIVEGASSYTESLVCSDVELNTDCKINDSGKEKCISGKMLKKLEKEKKKKEKKTKYNSNLNSKTVRNLSINTKKVKMNRNICHCLIFFVMVVICSLNCNGMRNVVNLQRFLSIVQDRKFGIVLLQETFWDDGFIQSIKHMYEGDIYYSNGTDGRQGVAVLASKYYKDKIKCIYKDDQGRFIHVTYHENDTLVNFVSLYAPNVVSDRGNFFDFVIDYTKDLDNLIIGGDFNTSLSVLDRELNKTREYYKLERQINNLCEKAASGIVIDIAKLESLKLELSNFEIEKCKGAVLRAKAIWAVESDKIQNTF
ncbi:unnamed protein product [Mytilus coruscus]|uniref:Reverse transcriptase domain-containing protein n=1 Tax=Mytilus coruscus TaxID=42192 RepID=A0A6J8CF75_MYTCO|nr:unnamed protein product [Mytilus coruscus]